MRLLTTLCSLWLTKLALSNADEPDVFCYYRNEAIDIVGYGRMMISDIDPSLCTYLIYGEVGVTEDGEVIVLTPETDLPDNGGHAGFQKFNALRKKNEKLRTLVATSSEDRNSATYSKIAADPSLRSKHVKNVVDFVLRHEFDGFDIDWEWPTQYGGSPNDVQNYPLLLKELRENFDKHNLILTIDAPGLEEYAKISYNIAEISKYPHFILLFMLWKRPTDSVVSHSTPLYPAAREKSALDRSRNYVASVSYWLKEGIPPKKLVLGTHFAGWKYNLNNSNEHEPGHARYNQDFEVIAYSELCTLISQDAWTTVWDEEQHMPYSYAGNQWIGYENVRSLTEKGKYAKAMGLGGVRVWGIEVDDHQGECGEKYPLLNALNCGLREIGCSAVPSSEASTPAKNDFATTSKSDLKDDPQRDAKRICAMLDIKYVRHPQNCAKFWICQKIRDNEFNAEPFVCGFGLYFNTKQIICESRHIVQCSSREVAIWSWD